MLIAKHILENLEHVASKLFSHTISSVETGMWIKDNESIMFVIFGELCTYKYHIVYHLKKVLLLELYYYYVKDFGYWIFLCLCSRIR